MGLQLRKKLRRNTKVLPADLPVELFLSGRKEALYLLNQFFFLKLKGCRLRHWDQLRQTATRYSSGGS